MALMVPSKFPHDLTKRPRLNGEALVYAALRDALNDDWTVLYDKTIKGSRRRIDFVATNPARGLLAVEVKGGMVHDKRGSFRQLISKTGQRKKIDPFGQLKLGVRDLLLVAGVAHNGLAVHQAIWFPNMGQGGLRWEPSPHILTRDNLEPVRLGQLVASWLPDTATAMQAAAVGRVIGSLRGR